MSVNHRILLRRRPEGLVERDDFEFDEAEIPEPGENEFLMQVEYLGMDATVRTWLSQAEGYLPPVEIGEVVRGSGVGRVMRSRTPNVPEGALMASLPGWQEYAVLADVPMLNTVLPDDTDLTAELGVYGAAGMTAYVGITDIGQVAPGETVVVSAAAGATGSLALQIARILGCRTVGIAGTDEKCEWLTNDLGADGVINYRTDDLRVKLKDLCPKGVDVYFDNVGGAVLDAVLGRLAQKGRVVLCGSISSYNEARKPPGPANYLNLISRRGRMEGFISWDAWDRWKEITDQLREWVADGRLQFRAHVFEGLEAAPDALNAMFTGENIGKIVVKL